MTYRPLPIELTITKSSIEGLGLFLLVDVDENHVFGISHIKHSDFENGYIRTPLGGFINHSEEPNCDYVEKDGHLLLKSTKQISANTELTTKYFLYTPMENGFK